MTNTRAGLWQIGKGQPKRLGKTEVNLEISLEDWIEKDPTLIRAGLTIVGRQLQTKGGPLDLLAIDIQGRWIIIEIKRKDVRRDTLSQAIDYASCISKMSEPELDEAVAGYLKKRGLGSLKKFKEMHPEFSAQPERREVEMIVVGTGRDSGLERIFDYLKSSFKFPVSIITFDVFQSVSGEKILVRELTESDGEQREQRPLIDDKEKALCGNAAKLGFGEAFESILKLSNRHGLKKRITNKSIMYAPPSDGRRVLFLIYGSVLAKNGGILVYVSTTGFKEFFQVSRSKLIAALGFEGWAGLKAKDDQQNFVRGLEKLLEEVLPQESA